jgi:neutral ceramidase
MVLASNRRVSAFFALTMGVMGLIMTNPKVFGETVGLKIGLGRSVITPFLDVPMAGYYYPRSADGVHDDLYAKTLILDEGRDQIVLVACDLVEIPRSVVEQARERITRQLKIPADHMLISATHSHTGPVMVEEYRTHLSHWIADSVMTARGRMQPARLFATVDQEPSLPQHRRYRMKDGTVATNPGFLNPNIVKPVGPIDPQVGLLYAVDAQEQPLMSWVNYAMHQDTVGGTLISADYAYFLSRLLGRVKGPDMLTVFTIGAAGNINHWDVKRPGPQRGFEEARRLGEILGAAVVRGYTHLEPVKLPGLKALSRTLELPMQSLTPAEVETARKILSTPPPPDVDFTLDRVKAGRVIELQEMKLKNIQAELQVISIGQVAIVGIPGELFVELGLAIQKQSPFPYTFIVELANGSIDYIPTREAYQQGAYEDTSARLGAGSGEMIVDKAVEMLRQLKME